MYKNMILGYNRTILYEEPPWEPTHKINTCKPHRKWTLLDKLSGGEPLVGRGFSSLCTQKTLSFVELLFRADAHDLSCRSSTVGKVIRKRG